MSEVLISVGTLFKVKRYPDRVDVVYGLDPNHEELFFARRCINQDPSNFKVSSSGGTADTSNIDQIIGSIDPKILEQAIKNAIDLQFHDPTFTSRTMEITLPMLKSAPRRFNLK